MEWQLKKNYAIFKQIVQNYQRNIQKNLKKKILIQILKK